MSVDATSPGGAELLGIYLNDHLAGATGGRELFRRAARAQRGTAAGATLQELCSQIEQDRTALLAMMGGLDIPVRSYKVWLGWTAEKAGRLKLNGSLLRRSALSPVIELEAMTLGVAGKAAGWRLLRAMAEREPRLDADLLDGLLSRAADQEKTLERLRLAAATTAFTG